MLHASMHQEGCSFAAVLPQVWAFHLLNSRGEVPTKEQPDVSFSGGLYWWCLMLDTWMCMSRAGAAWCVGFNQETASVSEGKDAGASAEHDVIFWAADELKQAWEHCKQAFSSLNGTFCRLTRLQVKTQMATEYSFIPSYLVNTAVYLGHSHSKILLTAVYAAAKVARASRA